MAGPVREGMPADLRGAGLAGEGVGVSLYLVPIRLREANAFVTAHHRHHGAVRGCVACVAVKDEELFIPGDYLAGVAIIGRPVARCLADGYTAEVTRVCTLGGRNVCSMLYAAAWRAVRALGYRRLVTYTLASEAGASLRAANFRCVGEVRGRSWNCVSRPRVDHAAIQDKLRWELHA